MMQDYTWLSWCPNLARSLLQEIIVQCGSCSHFDLMFLNGLAVQKMEVLPANQCLLMTRPALATHPLANPAATVGLARSEIISERLPPLSPLWTHCVYPGTLAILGTPTQIRSTAKVTLSKWAEAIKTLLLGQILTTWFQLIYEWSISHCASYNWERLLASV